MKRSFSFVTWGRSVALVAAGVALVAATYGLVRLAYGLLLPDVQRDLHLATPVAGAISAGASAVYCLGAVVGFVFARRRPRALVALAGASAALGAIGMAIADGDSTFAVAAVGASAGAGLASPALVALLTVDRATHGRPQLQSVVNAGTGPGLTAAALLALAIDDWRAVWIVASVATAIAAVAAIVSHHPDAAQDAPRGRPAATAAWLRAHAPIAVAALLMGAASAATWSFGRSILVDAGAAAEASIAAWVVLGLGGAGAVASAGLLERLGPRRAWAATVAVLAAATASLAAAPGSGIAAFVAAAAFGWGYTAGSGVLISWTRAIDASRSASGTAMLFVVLVLGQAAGAAVIGAAAPSVGLGAAFAAAALVACVSIAAGCAPWARIAQRADWAA